MPNPSLRSFSARTVLVTGATGFLGRHTVRALLLAGHRVVAVGLNPDDAQGINDWALDEGFLPEPFPARAGQVHLPTAGSPEGRTVLGWARMDLADMGSIGVLARALRGLDSIVHCDALSTRWAPASEFERINVGITRHVAMLAQLAKVPRLVHVSSPLVGVAAEHQVARDEYAPLGAVPLDAAAASRRDAETVLQTLLAPMGARRLNPSTVSPVEPGDGTPPQGTGRPASAMGGDNPVQVAIVRPQGLVGAGDPSVAPSFLGLARRGVLPVVRRGRAQVELTAVENVAGALAHLATTSDDRPFQLPADVPAHLRLAHPVYHLSNGEPMRVMDLIDGLCLNHGLTPRRLPVPVVLLNRVARLSEAFADRVHRASLGLLRWTPKLTRYMVAMLAFDHTLSIARAKAWGYAPSVRLGEGLHHHTTWCRAVDGLDRTETVRLSLVHAAPLPDVRGQHPAQRPAWQRPSVVRAHTVTPEANDAHVPEATRPATAFGPTARFPSVEREPLGHAPDPIDADQHRRLYGSDEAYGSGALINPVVWHGAEHNPGTGTHDHPEPSDDERADGTNA